MRDKFLNVHIIVEGKTEEDFVQKLLQSYLFAKGIFVTASQVSKPGQKGGDVRFARIRKEIKRLFTRRDLIVSTFVDYYGLVEWPGKEEIRPHVAPATISHLLTPEHINNSPETAPSKRLEKLCHGQFDKVLFGVHLAELITIDTMREQCPLFHDWLSQLEALAEKFA